MFYLSLWVCVPLSLIRVACMMMSGGLFTNACAICHWLHWRKCFPLHQQPLTVQNSSGRDHHPWLNVDGPQGPSISKSLKRWRLRRFWDQSDVRRISSYKACKERELGEGKNGAGLEGTKFSELAKARNKVRGPSIQRRKEWRQRICACAWSLVKISTSDDLRD